MWYIIAPGFPFSLYRWDRSSRVVDSNIPLMAFFIPVQISRAAQRSEREHTSGSSTHSTGAIDPSTVWKIAGEHDLESVLIGFPPSFPPKEIKGISVGCFLTPDVDANYTYPLEFKQEIEQNIGDYYVDAEINTVDRNLLLGKIYRMTEKRFDLIEYILKNKSWDFFIFVEIGIDRLHHAFWRYIDPQHQWHDPKSPLREPILKYYSFVDRRLGQVLDLLDKEVC